MNTTQPTVRFALYMITEDESDLVRISSVSWEEAEKAQAVAGRRALQALIVRLEAE